MHAPPASSPAPPARGGVFIRRQFELAALRGALDRACGGEDQLFVVAGEAGMGKTRLCQELAEAATRRGVQVLWGRCFEEPGAPPYWPWLQALRTLLDTGDDERLRALLGEGAAHIAAIVPELSRRWADLSRKRPVTAS